VGSGYGQGSKGNGAGANLAYTRFLFVVARTDDDAHGARLRTAGSSIARGFFNDFDIDDSRETQVQALETIQFLVREPETRPLPEQVPGPNINMARYAVQITSKYRPRLQEIDEALPVFDQVLGALRDVHQNPEWRYVQEGPIWRGRRVLRW